MFYGVGPKGVVSDPLINTNLNPYEDVANYYLSVGLGNGQRIQNMVEPSGNPTSTITTFQDYEFHELDEYNIAFVGRRWFGDKLDIETTKTFDFNFPNLVTTEPVKFIFNGASTSESTTNWTIGVNGSDIVTITAPGAANDNYGVSAIYENDITVNSDNISVSVDFDKLGVPSAVGYIDYISLEATRDLSFTGSQLEFYNKATAQTSGVGMYLSLIHI